MSQLGILYIVATPLGNLDDFTFRGLKVLQEVRMTAAEDTRRTRKLMNHFGIETRLVSYREQNHRKILPLLLTELETGGSVALVSDAGTPGISDPGAMLVREAAAKGITIVPIPGASAVATALSISGMTADRFVFAGFPPAKKKARRTYFEGYRTERQTLVFYESPHRIVESLWDMAEILGDREAVLCRELTKIHEEIIRLPLRELAGKMEERSEPVKGELTLVVAGETETGQQFLSRDELIEIVKNDTRPVKEIVKELGKMTSLSRSELYRMTLEATGKKE